MNKKEFQSFRDFVEADYQPSSECAEKIDTLIQKKLNPSQWLIGARFILIQMVSGMVTLLICPQFDIGYAGHNAWLHQLHLHTPSMIFYMICGFIYVTGGACLSGMIFTRDELRASKLTRYPLFLGYSLLVMVVFIFLGAGMFLVSAIAWFGGAMMGNILGFNITEKLRLA